MSLHMNNIPELKSQLISKTMEFLDKNPGAVQFGNFINYYQFNSADDRLKLLPTETWCSLEENQTITQPYLVLDVGCNSGVFTQLLFKFLKQVVPSHRTIFVYGVDIDSKLIERARVDNDCLAVFFERVDVMDDKDFAKIHQILQSHKRHNFDAVCCFSITMWIHLNHHDIGLKMFLRKLSAVAELIVIEPQPWKCYQTAERRMKKAGKSFQLFNHLTWRSNVEQNIACYLEQTLNRRRVYESLPTKWNRKIYFFR